MVIAGAGQNIKFITDHVVRVCGLSFGVVSADVGTVPNSLRLQAEFVLSEYDVRYGKSDAKVAFWRAIEYGPRYEVQSWRQRKKDIRHDPEWQLH